MKGAGRQVVHQYTSWLTKDPAGRGLREAIQAAGAAWVTGQPRRWKWVGVLVAEERAGPRSMVGVLVAPRAAATSERQG